MDAIVTDSFDMNGRVAIQYGATGVVICVTAEANVDQPAEGKNILIVRPDGWMVRTRMGEVKTAGSQTHLHTIFIPNLSKNDVPIGAHVRWGADFWPSVEEGRTALTPLLRA